MWQVLPDLFLGDYGDARKRVRLDAHGITHIVNCSRELPCKFEGEFTYLRLELDDPDAAFADKIAGFCEFIDSGRERGKVLVHCTMATSRSPAVVLAYLWHLNGSLERAAERLSRVVATGINVAFFGPIARHFGTGMAPAEAEALGQRLLQSAERPLAPGPAT